MKSRRTLLSLLAFLAVAAPLTATAQAWPSKPVQVVVPYAPGGSSDVIARILGAKLGDAFKQSIIVDNRPGAGTLLGTSHVAKSPRDGYTLLLADVPFTVNPAVVPAARYNPLSDFTPIALIGTAVQVLYANPSRVSSLADLLAKAKAKPGEVTVATAGSGTTTDLMTELFQGGANVKLLKVPYKGSAPALNDAAAGHVDAAFSTLASAAPLVAAGKLKVLAVAGSQRLATFPDAPTFAEAGIPSVNVRHWWGLLGPADIPQEVVQQLQREVARAVSMPDVQTQLRGLYVDPSPSTSEDFRKLLAEEVQRWTKVVKDNNIKAD